MTIRAASASIALAAAVAGWAASAAAGPDEPALPPAAAVRIDFDEHIKPILQERCLTCHARGKTKGGLSVETRESLLRGGEEGPAAVVGNGAESNLVRLAAGLEEGRRMPQKGPPLTDEQIGLLRAWVDQGLAWPEGFTFGFRRADLAPRQPEVPAAPAGLDLDHPVDRFLARSQEGAGPRLAGEAAPDRAFARRASLDLIGVLPTPEALDAFANDPRPDKRARLVEALLADRRGYADHWLTFWNDALRNAYRGTGFIDGGRKTITEWLYRSLYEDKPYDQFVRELVAAAPGAEGFTKGIVWRGVVNASQAPPVQAAQNVSQVFLGTNLKCASCHDSFVNYWKLTDSYALASVFADAPLELHRCDKPTGKISTVGFIYPELGDIDPEAPRPERMAQLAELLVKPEDGRFARTIVNRLWAHLMGRGLVEPLDDMDEPPFDADLLDWLAADFVAHGHDLKHTLALIATSRAYGLPAVGVASPEASGPFRFQGPLVKRMTAEQFVDAVSSVTGVWPQAEGAMLKVDGRGQGGQVTAVRAAVAAASGAEAVAAPRPPKVQAQWIWSHAEADKDPGGRILLRKTFTVERVPDRAVAVASCDNELVLYLNGRKVAESAEWSRPVAVEVAALLRPGENVIAAEATNWPDAEHGRGTQHKGPNPAGFVAWLGGFDGTKVAWSVGTDPSWLWARSAEGDAWTGPDFRPDGWRDAVSPPGARYLYGQVDLPGAVIALGQPEAAPIRAALCFDDPLQEALGRSERAHVVTRRDSVATTLQALELLNGATLDARLKQGARRRFEAAPRDPDALILGLFRDALGRAPRPDEREAARDLLGAPASAEGAQDLLWALFMLPEFQLIE